jgi:hypothetical protein
MAPTASHYELQLTVLAVAYQANAPVLVWGLPGEGKTSVAQAAADQLGVHAEVVIASLREPTDFNGLPVVAADGTVTLAPPAWLTATRNQDGAILVLDEATTAAPATRAALLRVVNERVSGDTPLNPTTRIWAIANPPEIAEDGWELGAPMSNRFLHLLGWTLPADVFATGLTSGLWPQTPTLTVAGDLLDGCLADARAAVAGFVRNDPTVLSRLPANPSQRQHPWPSPRSWTMCATLLGYARAARIDDKPLHDDVIALIVQGTVGADVAEAFISFERALTLPSPQELLENPTQWSVPDRGDLTWAVLSRLLGHLSALGDQATLTDYQQAGRVLAHAAEQQSAVAIAAASDWYAQARRFGPGVIPAEMPAGRLANVISLTG